MISPFTCKSWMSSSVTKFANLENVDGRICIHDRLFHLLKNGVLCVLSVNTYHAIIVQIFSMGQKSANKTGHFIRYEKGSLKNGTVVFAEW